ncbi:DEAD/DEAH box helicase-like protein [Candidatus Koribacter versatilis Ellin345]|uniref:DEAD/DEAH box helicase-like protein n=1 Tax=Koribacter versatilis (strain Ellin345) TaxID=204669 RepID=Q1IMK6_KORVE|nr:DEAD/DEAH box helicase-like protein [Candidatus Koribacter versatilis Ellin345]
MSPLRVARRQYVRSSHKRDPERRQRLTTFNDMPLSDVLKQRLEAAQFINPTPVQEKAIPPALDGRDILATAQTGTGKTLAFIIPALEMLRDTEPCGVQVLILVPTRELAMQVHGVYEQLKGKKLKSAALVMGGTSERNQIQSIRSGARVVVATPGRLEDYMGRRLVDLSQVEMLVLDEADRMMDMGFLPAIKRILRALPRDKQTLCFSATMGPAVSGIVQDCLYNAVRVEIGSILKPAAAVELHAIEVPIMGKKDALRQLLYEQEGKTLVFARTKRGTERLAKELIRDGFSAAMIHGDRSQSQRNAALAAFDKGSIKVLVATDVAARGLDVDDIAHVINFDLPQVPEDFIHRVGRTGRAGATGMATSLVSGAEVFELRNIERTLKLKIARRDLNATTTPKREVKHRDTLSTRTLKRLPGEIFA